MGDGIASAMGFACLPLTCLGSIMSVQQQTETLIFRFGKYESTLTEAGLYWNNMCGQ